MRLIFVCLYFALGISFARHYSAGESVCLLFAALAVLVGAWLVQETQWRLALAAAIAFGFGGLRFALAPQSSDIARFNGSSGTISGLIVDDPERNEERLRFRVAVESVFAHSRERESDGAVLVETSERVELRYGDRVRATGALSLPQTWDTFSYADYLARQGIFSIMRNASVEVVGSGHGSPIMAALLGLKAAARRQIHKALPEPQAGLLAGILLGDESGIAPGMDEAFRRSGAAHIIAISGFNMVVISGMVMRVFGGAGGRRWLATLTALIVIVLYSLLAGATGGILRAALMSGLLVIGHQLRRRTFLPTSLAFATLILALLDPHVLLDVGFQLSFCAVLGLGLFAGSMSRAMRQALERRFAGTTADWLHRALNEPLVVSVAAQIMTLPLIILYFGRLSLVALPVNLLIVPAQSVILILAFAATGLSFVAPLLGTLAYWFEMVFLSWTIGVVRGFTRWEYADIAFDIDARLIQIYYALIIGGGIVTAIRPHLASKIAVGLRNNSFRLAVGGAAVALLILLGDMALGRGDGQMRLWLLDVGHSNAALLGTPGGAQMLVDGGRFPARLLTATGDRLPWHDRHIELLAITHPDLWDIAALNALLDRYSVGTLLYHGQDNQNDEFKSIMRRLELSDTRILTVAAGHQVEFDDGVTIEILHPQAQPEAKDNLGDHAMTLRIGFGAASILLTSDLSREGQDALLESGVDLAATVLQLPQHAGKRTLDGEFMAAVQPHAALLQIDESNRRGDPDADTLRLVAEYVEERLIFRTDEMGTIELATDGETILVTGER